MVFGFEGDPFTALPGASWRALMSASPFVRSRASSTTTSAIPRRSYGLNLPDTSQKALLLAPPAGLEWTGDHLAFGLLPGVEFLIGNERTWALTLPVTPLVVVVPLAA